MRIFAWITVLGLVLGGSVWAAAPQQGRRPGWGGMMGGKMMGGSQSPQGAGGASSNYFKFCVGCHGATGKGNGPAAAALNAKPKDFTDCKVMTKISDDTLFEGIKGGGQSVGLSRLMRPWGGALVDQKIQDMVSYIRDFCKK